MYISPCVAATFLGACALVGQISAHSVKRAPLDYLTVIDDPVIHTPSNRVHALSSFDLTFDLHNKQQRIKLTLSPNHDVIAEGATISYLDAEGNLRDTKEIDRSAHRVFKGETYLQHYEGAEWTNVGWARVMVHRDGKDPIFEGAFRVDGDHHNIQTRTHYAQTKHLMDPNMEVTDAEYMVVWRDSDVGTELYGELRKRDQEEQETLCSAHELDFNSNPNHPIYAAMTKRDETTSFTPSKWTRNLFTRQIDGTTTGNSAGVNLTSTIGNSAGCPTTRKVALIGVATDCSYTADFANSSEVHSNIITQINSASTQYESAFNITLGIQNLTISDANCPATAQTSAPWNVGCSNSVTIQDRLSLFSAWRGERNDTNAYWTLLSTCNTGSAVGLAWLGQACVNSASNSTESNSTDTVSSANVVVRTSTEWQVIAHESGHTFGAVHDCTSDTCSDGTTVASQQCCPLSTSTCDAQGAYIMNPSTSDGITNFSPCSIGNVCSAIGRNSVKTTCLTSNRDVTLITASQCGNGIVESGEDCDCGGEADCSGNTCCDATTCKFTSGSVCDPSNEDCCTSTCQFAGSSTVCRASTGACDPQETCSGTSATCPTNAYADDGTSCGNSTSSLKCASGQCTSRDLQCKTLMGSITQGNDTYSCSDSGCQVSCASPAFGANTCAQMQQNFLDGTPCQAGGRCSNGQCKGATVGKEIKSWLDKNRTLVICLASIIGGLLVISILSCCLASCRRRAALRNAPRYPPAGNMGPPPGWAGNPRYMQPQPQMMGGNGYPIHNVPPSQYMRQAPPVRYA